MILFEICLQKPEYICAQNLDAKYISTYSKDNPSREDISESSIIWYAIRYKKDRQDPDLAKKVEKLIPNRIKYYEAKFGLQCHTRYYVFIFCNDNIL